MVLLCEVPVWDRPNHITGAVNVRLHHDPERGVPQVCAHWFIWV
jgi:hypothetical protein